jgi:uncharacterized protein YgbK (DUF1537 family)
MTECVVIADDLTGANATGVLLLKAGCRSYTIIDIDHAVHSSDLENSDCLCYATDSRSIPADLAYTKVSRAVKKLMKSGVRLYSKRIDTTLRGNLGSETDAMLDALGDNRIAMIVPCFPASKRITVGGYLLVNAIPLDRTEAARDPKNPIHTPVCAEIFRGQSRYPVDSIMLQDLLCGQKHVEGRIKALAEQGVRTIIFDAVTEEDIDLIARAVISSGVGYIAVDPGVFTARMAEKIIPRGLQKNRTQQKILAIIGSINPVARGQVEYFLDTEDVHNVYIETAEFLEGDQRRESEIARVTRKISDNTENKTLYSIIVRGIDPAFRVSFEPYAERYHCSANDLSDRINDAIAEITCRILSADTQFKGLYTCGGDITVAICRKMNSPGIKLLDEVLPLAAYGEISGDRHKNIKIVTKGGMVGEKDAIAVCLAYLRNTLMTPEVRGILGGE